MEEKSAFDTFELNFTDEIKGLLKETSNWTYFLSIVGFVGVGLLVVFGALFGVILRSMPVNPYENIGLDVNYFGFIYVVFALVYFFPILYLYKFSRKMKSALNSNSNDELINAFKNLKSHYKYIGIFVLVVISLYVLLFLIGGLGALI